MRLHRGAEILCAMLMIFLAGHQGWADPTPNSAEPFAAADAKILAEIRDHSEVMENLEYLSDHIGPRLTGSPQTKEANEWTAEMFRKYGLAKVHLEPWVAPHGWTRGPARARLTAPITRNLAIASAGWSPGTNGTLRGPVVYFDAKTQKEFEAFRGKLKGAIVIYQEPASLSPALPVERRRALLRPMQQPPAIPGQPAWPSPFAANEETARARTKFFLEEGVAGVMRDSNKPHALFNMTGISDQPFEKGAIPTGFLTGEDYRLIFRLLKEGPVQVEMEMSNSFSEAPIEAYNTVAEIRGREKPDEVVILGAHLDSWDLGSGSTDNGTGSMAVLEAARTLAKLNLKPKRTIRFVLFTGEEEGLVGSEKYVQAHKNELEKISGVLVHDSGTGRVLTLGLHDNYQDRELVDRVLAPLRELKLLEPSLARSFGTDHASFDEAGVPGFFCLQDLAEYSQTHHSQSDTFDKVWKDDVIQGAQVLAAWAYNTAELAEMLPRRPLPYRPAKKAAKSDPPEPDPIAETDNQILERVKADQPELQSNLAYLADRIGARLTGSAKLEQASKWAAEKFRGYGLANVRLEPWTITNNWTRGTASARIVAPVEQALTVASAGWSPSTNGAVRAKVIGVNAEKPEDLAQYKGKLKGSIVVVGPAFNLDEPENPLLTPFQEMSLPLAHPRVPGQEFTLESFIKMFLAEIQMFSQEGVTAALMPSDKEEGLLNMTAMTRGEYLPGKFPLAFLTYENHHLLWRLLESGPVEAEVNIQNSFSGKPVEVYNTVAEIRGRERPDEVVILGAHLDSWDLGTGATDNGTGAAAVLEAAHALREMGIKPKRTIRFVLFTGEEQGLNGSKAYVTAHQSELDKISGILIHDSGTGRVLTIGLMHNYGARETIDRVMYPLAEAVGLSEPSLRTEGGSDHVPFDQAGVPAFWCVQDNVDYDKTHHSQADTLDRVRWDDLTEGAQVLAVWAYNVAELADLLPRKPAEKKQETH